MLIVLDRKKLVLCAIAVFIAALCASLAFYSVPVSTEVNGVVLPVIMYHGLCPDKQRQNRYTIAPEYFEDDLRYLRDNGYTAVSVSELTEYFRRGKPLPAKPVMLTFDDGYLNNYTYAFPLLKKYNAKAVLSPIAAESDRAEGEENPDPRWSQCSWDELREMAESGLVEIENHSYDLHKLYRDRQGIQQKSGEGEEEYKKRIGEDIQKANSRIEEKTSFCPKAFVYPFGAKSPASEEVIRKMGFEAAFDCENRLNILTSSDDLYHIHRFLRPGNISAKAFFEKILGEV